MDSRHGDYTHQKKQAGRLLRGYPDYSSDPYMVNQTMGEMHMTHTRLLEGDNNGLQGNDKPNTD